MTTLAYIGSFEKSWSTETHLARDAEALGCTVHRIEERELAKALAGGLNMALTVKDVDLVLYTKTAGLPTLAGQLWRLLEGEGIKTASFHLDLYRGLARGTEILSDPFWQTQVVLTADGDPETTAELALLGINHRWLPPACVSDEAIPVDDPLPIGDGGQIVFVGSTRSYHAEHPWRLEMLAALRARYGHHFQAYGPQEGTITRGLDLNRLFQTPGRIVIGDNLTLPGHRAYFSDRYFETVGRGGFLIAPRVPGLEAFLQDGGHYVGYDLGDLDGLFELIDFYLDAPRIARLIARDGQAHVAANHCYTHRVREMLRALEIVESA